MKPNEYWRMSPIQTTGREMPMSTKIIDARSKSDRGLSADRMPTGRAISIHRIAPPMTSDAVIGTDSPIMSLTLRRLTKERPSDPSTTSRFRKRRYCIGTDRSRPRKWRARTISSGLALLPAASVAGSAGITKKMT